MDSRLGAALLRLTGLGLIAVALVALVVPRAVNVGYHQVIVAVLAIAFVVLARTVHLSTWMTGRRPWILALLTGAVAAFVGLGLRYQYGWDARVVIEQAKHLHSGSGLRPDDYGYLSLYPNNFPLLAIDRWGVGVADALGLAPDTVLTILTAVCVAVTSYAVHVLARSVSTASAAFGAQFVVLALVATSPWMIVPYTDAFAMPFVVGSLAVAVAAWRSEDLRRRVLLGLVAISLAAIGYSIKTTPIVLAVAGALAVLIAPASAATGKSLAARHRAARQAHRSLIVRFGQRLALVLVGVIVFLAVSVGATAVSHSVAGVDESRLRPNTTTPLWWIAGAQGEIVSKSGGVAYGGYRRDFVVDIQNLTTEQVNQYAKDFMADRWEERGLGGTLLFYANKAAWNWGDGMFWAWGEGGDSLPKAVKPANPVAKAINAFNGYHGKFYTVRADLAQGLWLALLLVTGLGLMVAKPRREVLLVALTVLGIAGFTLVFQGRSRYLFTFVPVVAALAAMVFADFRRLVGRVPLGRSQASEARAASSRHH